jgi:hypothetical protein
MVLHLLVVEVAVIVMLQHLAQAHQVVVLAVLVL